MTGVPVAKPPVIFSETRDHLIRGKSYFDLMENGKLPEGVSRVDGLPGVLCYDTGKPGNAGAIIIGTHMSELAGFTAAADFHERWEQGDRPPEGKLYVIIGGHAPTIKRAFDRLLANPPTVSEDDFFTYRSRIFDHSGAEQKSLNHNFLPSAIRDNPSSLISDPLYARIHAIRKLLADCHAGVLDIHSTSQHSPPTASPFTKLGDNERTVMEKLSPVIQGMPLQFITLYQEHNYPPGNKEEVSLRAINEVHDGSVSLLVEAGQHLDPQTFSNAIQLEAAWLTNVMHMAAPKQTQGISKSAAPVLLGNITKLYHPGKAPADQISGLSPDIVNDHYFLIHDTEMLKDGPAPGVRWSSQAQDKIAGYERDGHFGQMHQRLGFYAHVAKGDVLAVGLNTGYAVTAPYDGYVFMINKNPDLARETDTFGYIGKELSPELHPMATKLRAIQRTRSSSPVDATPLSVHPRSV